MTVSEYFEAFNQLNVLIVGDVMIDSYLWGKVSRISPEAPVPVVNAEKRENRLGGAANVARNIKALGANPILCAIVGEDEDGRILSQLLEEDGMSSEGIIQSADRITTVKHRILAGSQQMLRLDQEMSHQISDGESESLIAQLKKIVASKKIDIIIFEDYDKGVLHENLIQEIIAFAKEENIPTTVDPKKRNFLSYGGATLFKPNLKELMEGLNYQPTSDVLADVKSATKALKNEMNVDSAMITLSEHGVYITDFENEYHIPAHRREIADVSGAGDTVISIASACLALGMSVDKVAEIANLGGGLVCEHLGVVPIEKDRLEEEATKILG
ncbi:bifunctional heptose 7-phosphate kinase/heptose 1-phosphate adenyltransferase [Sediminitomix flava]|uniref:RfaE bifunctional protein kinase chain/domain n=1 Tax=Sediminitomix flava TaxID=379075 RepID=A0A315ZFP8_SEDFL|nr:PfkB family carbohydrate kinase [Sediminitomix flava]PWJ43979.1 rfaE bifunctional protein kinase chain/domain [Sediminitomix flava]